MRTVLRQCSQPTDHPIHVSDPRPSMHSEVDGLEQYLCAGGRLGDRRIQNARSIPALVAEVRAEQVSRDLARLLTTPLDPAKLSREDSVAEEPDEPDYDLDEAADRAEDTYVRWMNGE